MALVWDEQDAFGGAWLGYDGAYLVAQVVGYDDGLHHGFIRGDRVAGGPWPTAREARSAVDLAWAESA